MDKKPIVTFTKKWMSIIMIISLIDLQFPFILAYLGKNDIAETLGGLLVTEVIGVFLVYCIKSFFETREEKKNEMLNERWKEEIESKKNKKDEDGVG